MRSEHLIYISSSLASAAPRKRRNVWLMAVCSEGCCCSSNTSFLPPSFPFDLLLTRVAAGLTLCHGLTTATDGFSGFIRQIMFGILGSTWKKNLFNRGLALKALLCLCLLCLPCHVNMTTPVRTETRLDGAVGGEDQKSHSHIHKTDVVIYAPKVSIIALLRRSNEGSSISF